MLEFKDAARSDIRIKMALAGKSGAGKTLGALLIAKGLVKDPKKIGVVQTEAGRAQCYLNKIPGFKILEMHSPFSPEKFVESIKAAEAAGMECLILDSISDEWAGTGGALDIHSEVSDVTKNSFTAWKKVNPRHDAVFEKILNSPIHIIATVKKKTETVLETVNGKQVPKRIGLKDIQRDETEYKWMIQLDIDQEANLAKAAKDNSGIFQGKEPFKITEQTGADLRNWCLQTTGDKNVVKQSDANRPAGTESRA